MELLALLPYRWVIGPDGYIYHYCPFGCSCGCADGVDGDLQIKDLVWSKVFKVFFKELVKVPVITKWTKFRRGTQTCIESLI